MTMFNKEERTYWIENYKKFPTANISDAMDNLGLRSGVVLGLHALDVYQPRTAGFAKTIRQMRRKTAFDGKALTKQASIIDTQTEYGDLLVIEATGLTDIATGGAMLATRAQMRGVMGELTNGSLRDIDEIADLKFPVYLGSTSPVKAPVSWRRLTPMSRYSSAASRSARKTSSLWTAPALPSFQVHI